MRNEQLMDFVGFGFLKNFSKTSKYQKYQNSFKIPENNLTIAQLIIMMVLGNKEGIWIY